jgi:hypothetical protein
MAKFTLSGTTETAEMAEMTISEDERNLKISVNNITDVQDVNDDGTLMTYTDYDGNTFPVFKQEKLDMEIPRKITKFSATISNIMEDLDDDEFPIPIIMEVKGIEQYINIIVNYCLKYHGVVFPKKNKKEKWDMTQFDKNYIYMILEKFSEDQLFDMIRLSNYLDIFPLCDQVMSFIADQIKKMPAEDQLTLFEKIEHPEYYDDDDKRLPDEDIAKMKKEVRDAQKVAKAEKAEAEVPMEVEKTK